MLCAFHGTWVEGSAAVDVDIQYIAISALRKSAPVAAIINQNKSMVENMQRLAKKAIRTATM
jgi:hypothetical protein